MRDLKKTCFLIEHAVARLREADDEETQFDALNEIARLAGDEALDITIEMMGAAVSEQPGGIQ